MEGSRLERARRMTCKTVWSCCEKRIKAKLRKSHLNSPTVAKVFENKSGQVVEKNLSTSFCVCLVSWRQRNLEIQANIPKSCRRPVVSLLYATKSYRVVVCRCHLYCACALASPVTFLTDSCSQSSRFLPQARRIVSSGDENGVHVVQIAFGQISLSASSTRDLGTRLNTDCKTRVNYHQVYTLGQQKRLLDKSCILSGNYQWSPTMIHVP